MHHRLTETSRGGAKARGGEEGPRTLKKKAETPTRIVPADAVSLPRNTIDPIWSGAVPPSGSPLKARSRDTTMYLGRDQAPNDPGIKALEAAWANQTRFVVIVGKKYAPFPWSPGYRTPQEADGGSGDEECDNGSYAVLGWYRVRSCWCEYEPGRAEAGGVPLFVRWRFLFEWVAEQGVPWWLQRSPSRANPRTTRDAGSDTGAEDDEDENLSDDLQDLESSSVAQSESTTGALQKLPSSRRGLQGRIVTRMCGVCREPSPQVYSQGWFCTNWSCPQFSMVRLGNFCIRQKLSRLVTAA